MIFLKDNTLLTRRLRADDIKPRLLGHWGTCPGLSLVYAHLNKLIRDTNADMLYVVGPGHGAPGILASLWLEGSLERFYPQYARTTEGLKNLITGFSTPAGFPSHINAEVPGSIHEGGELGYALGVAYGAVMDKPDLIATVVVGDGEAETGPTAAAWHAHKFVDPTESGAVLPILHVNGFKISEATVFGCMDNLELVALFTGYGYLVRIVDDLNRIDEDMAASMRWAYDEIRKIQERARGEGAQKIFKPRWPMIILKTPKGWTGPKEYKGKFIEGSFKSHQVPIPDAKSNEEGLTTLNDWLESYKPKELFTDAGAPIPEIDALLPAEKKRMGQLPATFMDHHALTMPDWRKFGQKNLEKEFSSMKTLGEFLAAVIKENPKTFRIFSPDELESNKLTSTLDPTSRVAQHNHPPTTGRIIEMLSEHTLQSFLQGYTLTGRTGLFPSYESFLGIVHTMMVQYSKFQKLAATKASWRGTTSSINYLETSTWTRQEHNGFSHQNPSFIGAVLNLKPQMARVYLPPDANCALSVMHHCLKSQSLTNLIVGSKQPTPVYLSVDEAAEHCKTGAGIFKFASSEKPEVVLVALGTETTFEVVHAASILRKKGIATRVVNVVDLFVLAAQDSHPHALSDDDFNDMFTKDKPLVFNYHGYVNEIVSLLWGRVIANRPVKTGGYREEGTTTTPFAMMLENQVDRWSVVRQAVEGMMENGQGKEAELKKIVEEMEKNRKECNEFILKEGIDMDGIYDMPKFEGLEA